MVITLINLILGSLHTPIDKCVCTYAQSAFLNMGVATPGSRTDLPYMCVCVRACVCVCVCVCRTWIFTMLCGE
jgi:hypothetical protein